MKKAVWVAAATVCAIATCVCIWMAVWQPWNTISGETDSPTSPAVDSPPMTKPSNPLYDPQATYNPESAPNEKTEYISPIDFEYLKSVNPDIYAWIEIPGTKISYPVLQSATNDRLYLDHDINKKKDVKGSIYSEHYYNDTDFSDMVTVLYGHNMSSKYQSRMFGELQSLYWDEDFLRNNNEIMVYLPDKELCFEIFAALPFSRMHILHYYQTEKESAYELLVDDIYATRRLNTVLLPEQKPTFGDQLLVLSTCLAGDNNYRYLVVGALKGED